MLNFVAIKSNLQLCALSVEEEGGILDLVVSAITGDDDDDNEKTKPEVNTLTDKNGFN